jgi:hypothetical protein
VFEFLFLLFGLGYSSLLLFFLLNLSGISVGTDNWCNTFYSEAFLWLKRDWKWNAFWGEDFDNYRVEALLPRVLLAIDLSFAILCSASSVFLFDKFPSVCFYELVATS